MWANLDLNSLTSLAIHWKRPSWDYVDCDRSSGLCSWRLAGRGRAWLVRWWQFMPLGQYQTEVSIDISQSIQWLKTETMAKSFVMGGR